MSKFCPNCGANLSVNSDKTKVNKSNNSIKCMYCGSDIPIGSDKCFKCGKYLNPAANEKHTAVIVIGYIGIYLLTRPNKEVHKHGIIIIVLTIIVAIIAVALWIDYINYVNAVKSYSYYDSYDSYYYY